MRIVQVTPRYDPHIGGVEKFVQKISEELVKKGHEVKVLTADAQKKESISNALNGVTINRFFANGPFYYSRELYKYLITYGKEFDIVHVHNFHTLLPVLCAKAKEAGQKFNLILMGHYHGKGSTPLTNILLKVGRNLFSLFYKQADFILCHTEYEKQLLIRHFQLKESMIRMIPSGVAVDEISKAVPFAKTGRILLIVSRIEKYKNIHLAIRAMTYLPGDYKLCIIGEGPYRRNLYNLATSLVLDGRVNFLGHLSNEEVYRWYKTCDLVINFSELEAFGLTVIEGLAAGKPVLVNNRTALSELARRFEGVTAVDAWRLSPHQLAKVIEKRVEGQFCTPDLSEYKWEAIANKLENYYKTML